jgi:hypothetical protein
MLLFRSLGTTARRSHRPTDDDRAHDEPSEPRKATAEPAPERRETDRKRAK